MQDIHSIGGGRLLAGGAGGDRRLRPHHHQNQQAALKCPRCDSLNTKFCYYNNYNLSQPRHFCKSCRRYWTKGGVLRNVPVGGGCRKTKPSKPKASSATSAAAATTTTVNTTTPPPAPSQDRKSNSNSSSESSSLTAATNTTATATVTEAVSAPSTTPASNLMKINQESKFFAAQSSSNPSFEAPPSAPPSLLEQGGSNCGIFSEIGSLTSLIASSATGAMPNFEYGSISDVSISPFRLNQNHHQQQQHNQHPVQQSQSWHEQGQKVTMSVADDQELKAPEITGALLDRTVQVDLSVLHDGRSNGGGFESLGDWQHCGDQGLFDLPYTVDQAYWSQSHWTDQDHPSLYLP